VNPTKSLSRVEVKDASKGEIVAVFSTLGVIDSDGDVTLPGAFESGAKVRISAYGHTSWGGRLPVGKGTITEVGNEAILEGQFFLDTVEGRDTFAVVKQLGEDGLQEFSYGYDVVKASFGQHEGQDVRFLEALKVHEVSPVLLGAGVGTRLLTAKSGMKFSDHVEAVLAELDALLERATDVVALRAEKGKAISDDSVARLTALKGRIEELVARTPIPPADDWSTALDLLAASASLRGATTT
jgi:HK97 family phage prohead protease